jgi:hypothetical protein
VSLPPSEKVARAAARLLDSIGPDAVSRARATHANVKGVGGQHFITNGRIVALADAVDAWREGTRSGGDTDE